MSTATPLPPVSQPSLEVGLKIESLYTLAHHFKLHARPSAEHQVTPQMELSVTPRYSVLTSSHYEVVLALDLKARQGEAAFFDMGLEQAGLFVLEELSPENESLVLYGLCPPYLFPYAGVWVNQTLSQAGLPPMYLTPLDFLALYGDYQNKNIGKVLRAD